jgi:hypothetical protein
MNFGQIVFVEYLSVVFRLGSHVHLLQMNFMKSFMINYKLVDITIKFN